MLAGEILHHLITELHSHALFRHRPEQRFEHQLAAMAALVTREIRSQAFERIAGHKRATGADSHVVEIVSDR